MKRNMRDEESGCIGSRAVLSAALAFVLLVGSVPFAVADEQGSSEARPEAAASAESDVRPSESQPADNTPASKIPARISQDVELEKPADREEGNAGTPPVPSVSGSSNQATAEVPLATDDPKPSVGTLVFDGLEYALNPDGLTVALTGFHGELGSPDVAVPSEIQSGDDVYAVTTVEFRGGALISVHLK